MIIDLILLGLSNPFYTLIGLFVLVIFYLILLRMCGYTK